MTDDRQIARVETARRRCADARQMLAEAVVELNTRIGARHRDADHDQELADAQRALVEAQIEQSAAVRELEAATGAVLWRIEIAERLTRRRGTSPQMSLTHDHRGPRR